MIIPPHIYMKYSKTSNICVKDRVGPVQSRDWLYTFYVYKSLGPPPLGPGSLPHLLPLFPSGPICLPSHLRPPSSEYSPVYQSGTLVQPSRRNTNCYYHSPLLCYYYQQPTNQLSATISFQFQNNLSPSSLHQPPSHARRKTLTQLSHSTPTYYQYQFQPSLHPTRTCTRTCTCT